MAIENITSRNQKNTSRIFNADKIYNYVLEQKGNVTITQISENTQIDLKNISRYINTLESKGKITRKTIQEGKKRFVYVNLPEEKIDNNTSRKEKLDDDFTSRNKNLNLALEKKGTAAKNNVQKSKGLKKNNKGNDPSSKKSLNKNDILEEVSKFLEDKSIKGYTRILKILTIEDKNRNYQYNLFKDLLDVLIEIGRVK